MASLLSTLSLPLLFTFLLLAAADPSESSPSPSPQQEISPSPSPALAYSPPAPPPSDLAPSSPSPAPYSGDYDDANDDVPAPAPAPAGDVNLADQANVEAKDENSGGMSGGKKAGIAIGVIGAACVAGVGVVVYKKRQQNIQRSQYGDAARREFL